MMNRFINKHLGYNNTIRNELLKEINQSYESFYEKVIGSNFVKYENKNEFNYNPKTEHEAINQLKKNLRDNHIDHKSYIGQGFYNTFMPYPIKKYVLNNPKWYTPYTPYQAEINQGKLELLHNFQNMICEITNMPISNCGLLDEVNAASESVSMINNYVKNSKNKYVLISDNLFPIIQEGIKTRCNNLDIKYKVIKENDLLNNTDQLDLQDVMLCMVQNPSNIGNIIDYENLVNVIHENNGFTSCGTDLMACQLIKPPGDFNFDIVYGNCQRFGLSLGYGGPHSAFFAVQSKFLRHLPGKFVGDYVDDNNNKKYRMALQTREQHIKKDRATSNICTSQILLNNMSCLYAIYHGEKVLHNISQSIMNLTNNFVDKLKILDFIVLNDSYFDTILFYHKNSIVNKSIGSILEDNNILISQKYDTELNSYIYSISFDETKTDNDVKNLLNNLYKLLIDKSIITIENIKYKDTNKKINHLFRDKNESVFKSKIFKNGMNEMEFMRYTNHLIDKDYSLVNGMIPLGSCTMKLNASYQLEPLNWDYFDLHPYIPRKYTIGIYNYLKPLSDKLLTITGMDNISYQSCSGSMGEYSGLITIKNFIKNKNYSESKIVNNKDIYCLIPESAHGTNFASAKLAGFKIIKVKMTNNGEVCLDDLKKKTNKIFEKNGILGCLMITYPSTYGLFDSNIKDIIDFIHDKNGQIYLDGANMNAIGNVMSIGDIGFDVAHLNLHKTFCIPHGGGGPGMGPIVVKKHLKDFLPTHPTKYNFCNYKEYFGDENKTNNVIASSPFSSASILSIPYLYLECLDSNDLKSITFNALLSSNYLSNKLSKHYNIKYKNSNNRNSHEFIINLSEFKSKGITELDICKRLIDYEFYPPTMSWPVSSSIMIEPTECENKEELDRFINAMISIRKEIDNNNVELFKNSPHSKEYLKINDIKYISSVNRVNDVKNDTEILKKHLF